LGEGEWQRIFEMASRKNIPKEFDVDEEAK
jgi:hypothetical protein